MKKILLNGATRSTNFGDFLFAYIFQKEVSEIVGKENVYWYESPFALSTFFREHLNYTSHFKLKEIDSLVCISGGYFCGNDKNIKDYIYRYFSYWHICLKCILRKKPIAIIGLDVSEPKSSIMKQIEKKILKYASIITVRNKESIDQLHKYGIDSAEQTADTAHIISDYLDLSRRISINLPKEKKILFLHISSVQQTMIYLPAINDFLFDHGEYSVLIGTDQFHDNYEYLNEIKNNLKCQSVEIYRYDNPLDLCYVLKEVDFVVTPKLHVGIVASTFGKSVVSFPGHAEKIQRYYKQLSESDRCIPIVDYNQKKYSYILEKYHSTPIVLNDSVITAARKNISYLKDFVLS